MAQRLKGLACSLPREHCGEDEVLDEIEFVERWAIPAESIRADVAVVAPSGSVLVADFVSRQFTRGTTATGDFAALAKDLRLGVIEKLQQVDATLSRAVAAESTLSALYPVVVTAGPLRTFPPLIEIIDEQLIELDLAVVGNDERCHHWLAMDLLNFDLLLRAAQLLGVTWHELIDNWYESALAGNTFRDWLLLDGPGGHLEGGGLPDDWRSRMSSYLLDGE